MLKQVFFIAGIVGAAAALFYLYQRQLGAISFFITSIYFFYLAFSQLKKAKKDRRDDSIK